MNNNPGDVQMCQINESDTQRTGNLGKNETKFALYLFIYLFIYLFLWLCWVFVAACGLSLVVASGGYSSLRCMGFSWGGFSLLWNTGSRHAGFCSCGTQAQ